jgi:polysaccharide biosynthesis transport protein
VIPSSNPEDGNGRTDLERRPPGPPADGDTAGQGGWAVPSVLTRRWRTIVLIATLVVVAVFVLTSLEGRVYDATATVVLDSSPGQSPGDAPSMPTEQQVGGSPAVARLVIGRLHLHTSPETLLRDVSVSVPLDSQVLKFTYSSASPAVAQMRAQAFATAYLKLRREQQQTAERASTQPVQERITYLSRRLSEVQRRLDHAGSSATASQLQTQATSLTSQVVALEQTLSDLNASATTYSDAALIGPASRPTSPARPKTLLNLTLGLVGGLVLGLGIAAAQEYTDDRIRSRGDLRSRLQAPVLGPVPVPRLSRYRNAGLVTVEAPRSAAAESYRRLAAEFLVGARTAKATSVVITSGEPLDGKAFVTANLAVALARAGKRVLVVACGGTRPSLEEVFSVAPRLGWAEVIRGSAALRDAIAQTPVRNLYLLGPGTSSDASMDQSIARVDDVVEMLRRERRDVILIDAPPVVGGDDAVTVALAAACDGVVLVSQTTSTTTAGVARARQEVEQLGSTLLAGVLVKATWRTARRSSPAPDGRGSTPGPARRQRPATPRDPVQSQNAS